MIIPPIKSKYQSNLYDFSNTVWKIHRQGTFETREREIGECPFLLLFYCATHFFFFQKLALEIGDVMLLLQAYVGEKILPWSNRQTKFLFLFFLFFLLRSLSIYSVCVC